MIDTISDLTTKLKEVVDALMEKGQSADAVREKFDLYLESAIDRRKKDNRTRKERLIAEQSAVEQRRRQLAKEPKAPTSVKIQNRLPRKGDRSFNRF
jgi:hypothetical protein